MMDEQRGLPLGFQFYAGVTGIYDDGLTPVSVDQSGNLLQVNSLYGIEANIGLTGQRRTAKGVLALTYTGSYRHYTQNSYFDGSDHILQLQTRKILTKRFSISSQNSAGTVSRAIPTLGGLISTPDQLIGVPTNELFDNRTYYVQTRDDLIFQKSARLSFSVGGDGFLVRRQSKALVGLNGYGAHATMAYRFSQRSTVDLAYSFFHFDYPRSFGESDIHQTTVGFSRLLSARWQVSLSGGVYHLDTIGITQVALDPATAALFGQATSTQAFQAATYRPSISGSLSGNFRRSQVSFSYMRSPSAGNGIYLSSNQEGFNSSLNYTGTSRMSLNVDAGYQRLKSVGQQGLGVYQSGYGGGGVSYRIGQALHAAARVDFRQAQIDTPGGFNRLGTRVSVSMNYSAGERPLRVWR